MILSLVGVMMADAAGLTGGVGYMSRLAVPAAAILMPTGFFVSSSGAGATAPNSAVVLLWIGAACLAVGVVTLGIGLLRSSLRPDPPAPAST